MKSNKSTKTPIVVSFYSYRGGTGKSTLSSNIAYISSKQHKTILVDLDLYSPQLNYIFNREHDFYINDYFHSQLFEFRRPSEKTLSLEDIICQSRFSDLDLILANPKLSLTDNTVLHNETTTKKLFPCMQHIVEQLKTEYQVIIIDCPGELNFYTLNAIAVSHRAVGAIMPTIANINGMMELLSIFKTTLQGKISDIILTMVSTRLSHKRKDQIQQWKEKFQKNDVDNFLSFVYSDDIAYRHQFEQDFFYLEEESEYKELESYLNSILR